MFQYICVHLFVFSAVPMISGTCAQSAREQTAELAI